MEVSGSLEIECRTRLTNLYNESHNWLLQAAYKVTKNKLEAEDIISELYEYLHKKQNKKLFWGNSYNLLYCTKYIKHRFINKTKKLNRTSYVEEIFETNEEDIPYDTERDIAIQKAYDDVLHELRRLETTKSWTQSKIFQLYFYSDKTLDEVANDIKISKSTVFLSVKKIRQHLKKLLDNPFDETR